VARATNQNLLDAKQEKSPSKRNKTHLPPAEDDTATTAANELRRGRNKSGFQRALEKASRRNWSKKELTSFINTKTSARRNDSKVPRSPLGEDRPFDERPEKQPIDERKVRCDESSEMGVTSSTDQAQIVAVESKEWIKKKVNRDSLAICENPKGPYFSMELKLDIQPERQVPVFVAAPWGGVADGYIFQNERG
jgi:hypothetical protein